MRIGEVAERAGISSKALRYYERVGLLDEPGRTPSGYRDYPAAVIERLRFVRAAKAVGLTLGEIRGIVDFAKEERPPCAHVLGLIDRRAAELDERIGELVALREELVHLSARGRGLAPEDCSADLVCHILNPPAA